MTRTNKRIKQGNTRKIKKKKITILQLYQGESYPNMCRLHVHINNTLVYIYIYKHDIKGKSTTVLRTWILEQ